MTPGIQPSNVKIMLRKKLAIRPVMSTASGGKTTQKKYRSAFIYSFLSLISDLCLLPIGFIPQHFVIFDHRIRQ
jgi:hypothetical protein